MDEMNKNKMQGLKTFSQLIKEQKKDCNSINTIQDINSQYSYEDTIGGGGLKETHEAFKKCVGEKLGIVL